MAVTKEVTVEFHFENYKFYVPEYGLNNEALLFKVLVVKEPTFAEQRHYKKLLDETTKYHVVVFTAPRVFDVITPTKLSTSLTLYSALKDPVVKRSFVDAVQKQL